MKIFNMVVIDNTACELILPKVNRCFEDECNVYQLILQKRSTNSIMVFKLRDLSSGHPLRYYFPFAVPKCMAEGEYNLFLVRPSEWNSREINDLFVNDTIRETDKQAITCFGRYVMSGNRILVSSNKKVLTGIYDQNREISYVATEFSDDNRAEGELFEELKIIYSGLLKYKPSELLETDYFVEPKLDRDNEYKEYFQ